MAPPKVRLLERTNAYLRMVSDKHMCYVAFPFMIWGFSTLMAHFILAPGGQKECNRGFEYAKKYNVTKFNSQTVNGAETIIGLVSSEALVPAAVYVASRFVYAGRKITAGAESLCEQFKGPTYTVTGVILALGAFCYQILLVEPWLQKSNNAMGYDRGYNDVARSPVYNHCPLTDGSLIVTHALNALGIFGSLYALYRAAKNGHTCGADLLKAKNSAKAGSAQSYNLLVESALQDDEGKRTPEKSPRPGGGVRE